MSRLCLRWKTAKLVFTMHFVLLVILSPLALSQTFSVIHTFASQGDGYQPYGGLTLDRAGNIYGTTTDFTGPGSVFQMKRSNGGWILNTLYTFNDSNDGGIPYGGVVFGPDGTPYGTTREYGLGGGGCGDEGCGIVYNLRPPQTVCKSVRCDWTETVLYNFTGGADGGEPWYVDPVFDQAGNLYGTASQGGSADFGVVFKLTPSDGHWTDSTILNFTGDNGVFPTSGVIIDGAGNLYGSTFNGGSSGDGNVYQLAPSGSGWVATNLHVFQFGSDGAGPVSKLILDSSGNLYGTTLSGGSGGGGTVYRLSPSGGSWTFDVVYGLPGQNNGGPQGTLAIDATGNLYGATFADGAHGLGSVFKLTPANGGWTYTNLHDFTGGVDGASPIGGVAVDASGNLYGTTSLGGMTGGNCPTQGCGVVWEITP